jgi:repressor of nif and glnA expression
MSTNELTSYEQSVLAVVAESQSAVGWYAIEIALTLRGRVTPQGHLPKALKRLVELGLLQKIDVGGQERFVATIQATARHKSHQSE